MLSHRGVPVPVPVRESLLGLPARATTAEEASRLSSLRAILASYKAGVSVRRRSWEILPIRLSRRKPLRPSN
jgi:hypothetical protein